MEIGPKTQKAAGVALIVITSPLWLLLLAAVKLTLLFEPHWPVMPKDWHPWFAWRPVRLEDGTMVWWEHLERINRASYGDPWPFYRRAVLQQKGEAS
jgi:hypothetical protein